jgi:hypothetical protein
MEALGMITSMSQLMTSLAAAAFGYTQGLATITDMPSRVDDMADFVAYYLAKEHGKADAEGSVHSMMPVLVMIRDGDGSAIHRTIGN